ncbi:MAG: transglycosylase SLT domain-containing protein [Treponema sp.]|jgi:membrane-bound lytic murein transglycosylase D|nr:transglycosylase SLT domain-containing protein [Treponema sp.]
MGKLSGKGRFASFITVLLLTLRAGFVWAQTDEGRPLRTVPQDTQADDLQPAINDSHSPLFPANSLITHSALEQPLTQRYIAQYSSPGGIEYLNASLERGSVYLPFIKEEITRRNLPPELTWLPIIESGFQITARSGSGAVGLWQFMLNSISPFDIRVNDFVDERRDFIKSTIGALQKLEDNYRMLGSWELALAAYNYGLGGMTRTIQRTGIRDYWELGRRGELRQETEHYVPKLIAAAYVLSQPRKYNINVWHKPLRWAAIPLLRQVSLDIIAEEAVINRDLLQRLNAQFIHGISPADGNYQLIVPAEKFQQVSQLLEREDIKLLAFHYHVVRQGDTLWSLSRYYSAPLNMIEQQNPGITSRYLRIGETVIIPAFGEVTPPVRPVVIQSFDGSHVVKRGETFWSLGRMYGVDPEVLAESNGMRIDQILHEGRTLKVPIIE